MKGNDGWLIMLCLVVGVPILLIQKFWPAILLIVAAIVIIAIVAVCSNDKQFKNIKYTERLPGKTSVYQEGYEHSGFSFSTSGNARTYYRKRRHKVGDEVAFNVTYNDLSCKIVKVMYGSDRYYFLMDKERKPEKKIESNAISKPEAVAEAIAPETEKVEERTPIELEPPKEEIVAEVSAIENKRPEIKAKFIKVESQILPNEVSARVENVTCISKYDTLANKGKFIVQFMLYFDPTPKGLTNRTPTVTIIDKDGNILDTSKSYSDRLDKSGVRAVKTIFYDNLGVEPAKVAIGIDRWN